MRDNDYKNLFAEIKQKINEAQLKTVVAANSHMLFLYWQLGGKIIENQQQKGWGAKIIELLSTDLGKEFPDVKGFSPRNLLYMKQFASVYSQAVLQNYIFLESQIRAAPHSQLIVSKLLNAENEQLEITQQPVAQLSESYFFNSIVSRISWSHHIVLMDKVVHLGKRFWYMLNILEHGISRNVLTVQIESKLFERQVKIKKVTNFENTLPPVQSDYAGYILKDPYIFDFIQAKEKADELNIEKQLANHVTKFLLELGQGFAFIGRQVRFQIGNADFYADLLFYHTKLHCFIVVELKARPFEPGDPSQLNFYINVINDKLKTPTDNDTIGLLLCKGKNEVIAEYSLKGFSNPIGVSDYQLSKAVPDELKSSLPQIEEIENELNYMK